MYDMECDDDDWKQFLQGFTEPLEELFKQTEDEEQDPEYNIMADDKINDIDNEEFRMDKAVKITKKEVQQLWEEFFEYLSNASDTCPEENGAKTVGLNSSQAPDTSRISRDEINSENFNILNCSNVCEESTFNVVQKEMPKEAIDLYQISHQHLCILEQQMRQHIQMLTQNFLLTYDHPELHSSSVQFKEYLLNLKFLSEGKMFSTFRPINLFPALKLIEEWIEMFSHTDNENVKKTKEHVQAELLKSVQYKMTGNWQYLVTFPKLILETIAKSDVFLYPALLPKIPFKSDQFASSRIGFTAAEDHLLVFGLDMFEKFLFETSPHLKNLMGKPPLKKVVALVSKYMMPHRSSQIILKHIYQSKHPRCLTNPIQQYMLRQKLTPIVHYVYPLQHVVPPCRRLPKELPEQWRNFIYPTETNNALQNTNIIVLSGPLNLSPIYPSPVPVIPTRNVSVPKAKKVNTSRKSRAETSVLIQIINSQDLDDSDSLKIAKCNEGDLSIYKANTTSSLNPQRDKTNLNTGTSLEHFLLIFSRLLDVQKLVNFLAEVDTIDSVPLSLSPKETLVTENSSNMMPSMPSLNTPIKTPEENNATNIDCSIVSSIQDDSTDGSADIVEGHKRPQTITSNTIEDHKRLRITRSLEFSTITSSSFQKANASTEVEFCRNSSNIQICQMSQSDEHDLPSSSGYSSGPTGYGKDNPENINGLHKLNSTVNHLVNPHIKKKLSAAERKKNKLKKDFLTNLAVATPDDPETEKHKNEVFAVTYYDKLRKTLELNDYNQIMQVLNNFESGDVVDLYKEVQAILRPKYIELADDFLFFLREKEASAVGQLIPWLELQIRVKFLRKLEIFLKDQPTQLKRIYNALMELAKAGDTTMEKAKSVLVPMLKGNKILMDLFLQSFRDERPPPSLLDGHYETIDINKELARPDNEQIYETFVVPNTEDKYGGQNCICHCHKIEDNEYKSRYKHCNSCGLKFANGKPYLATGRVFQPAMITFKTNPHINHNIRLMGKSTSGSGVKKKRSNISPNKLSSSSTKENLEEDTEDEDLGKRKKSLSQRTPGKRKKASSPKYQEEKSASPKKSPGRSWELLDAQKDSIKPRKRTYSGRKSRKEDSKKTDLGKERGKVDFTIVNNLKLGDLNEKDDGLAERLEEFDDKVDEFEETLKESDEKEEDGFVVAEIEESEHETSEEHPGKSTDDCMDSSGESLEKPLTPGQQTTESETEIYLEESSQDNYASDDSTSSTESVKGSQSDSNTNDEPPWQREEDTVILETLQKEDDKEYALQIISDKLPNRTVSQIRSRLSRLMDLLIETLKNT
ncbi:uncharacterized protein mute isoform X1 [Euwallacea fornicatus]|uniref:uncharacterized protein mute isoform X1 n=1 Tax=Euwallacea fornicatus TaxID=995702 RepID=UPI00338E049B